VMDGSTPVDRLYIESAEAVRELEKAEPSLAFAASDTFRKALVLGAASYFEHRLCACVSEFVHERSGGSGVLVSFVKNKAITRQYHTWFAWDESHANQFFGLFGAEFRRMMVERVKGREDLKESIRAFLEMGSERNKMAHQDFASFPLEKTLDEIYALYKKALLFVEELPKHLRDC
jgi:RiboL-PSP-HEPN